MLASPILKGDVMKAVVIGLIVVGMIIVFLIGIAVIVGASEDSYREADDRDQEEYIRRWAEEQKRKDERKHSRRPRR
jgi:hypothetical protein